MTQTTPPDTPQSTWAYLRYRVNRDARGAPSGVFVDNAIQLVAKVVKPCFARNGKAMI